MARTCLPVRRWHGAAGFSLLEVLLAMLVLGVAVLGFAALQVRALETTGVSHLRAQAAVLAADLAERARMVTGANDYPGCAAPPDAPVADFRACVREALVETWATGEQPPAGTPADWTPGDTTCLFAGAFNAAAARCADAAAVARADMLELRFLAAQLLPAGTIDLRACDDDAAQACIVLGWRGADAADPDACPADAPGQSCLVMRVLL